MEYFRFETRRRIQMTQDIVLFALPAAFVVFAFLLALSFLTPSWHWVAAIILIGCIGICAMWIAHFQAAARPGYKEGPGGGLGILVIGTWSWAFIFASVAWVGATVWWHQRVDGRRG
jgi:hypothetical protein